MVRVQRRLIVRARAAQQTKAHSRLDVRDSGHQKQSGDGEPSQSSYTEMTKHTSDKVRRFRAVAIKRAG